MSDWCPSIEGMDPCSWCGARLRWGIFDVTTRGYPICRGVCLNTERWRR